MTKYFFTLLLGIICMSAVAQRQFKMFTNSQKIDSKRYEGIRGTPMMFEEWQKGTIIDKRDSLYTDISLNYNGFEEEFEVKRNNSNFIALDSRHYKKVVVESATGLNGEVTFEKVTDNRFKNKFLEVIHKGEKVTVYKYFEARKSEVVVQDVGKTKTYENFQKVAIYYKLDGEKLRIIKTKKKNLVAELGEKKALESYIKKNKLKTNKDLDLRKLLAHFETL